MRSERLFASWPKREDRDTLLDESKSGIEQCVPGGPGLRVQRALQGCHTDLSFYPSRNRTGPLPENLPERRLLGRLDESGTFPRNFIDARLNRGFHSVP